MESTDKLLPCPFCGGEAHTYRTMAQRYCAICNNLFCASVGPFDTEAEAITAWNTRAVETCEEYGSVRIWQSCNVWSHELSCGHEVDTLDGEPPNYCPNCGAKVVGE